MVQFLYILFTFFLSYKLIVIFRYRLEVVSFLCSCFGLSTFLLLTLFADVRFDNALCAVSWCPNKNLRIIPCLFQLCREVTWIQKCASLSHFQVMKAEPSGVIPRKLAAIPKLLIVQNDDNICNTEKKMEDHFPTFEPFTKRLWIHLLLRPTT